MNSNQSSPFIVHQSNSRGAFKNSWLSSFHSFSFGDYYEPSRIGFGALRVLNDDAVAAEGGFATHPHDNMEIVSIPLLGSLSHRDSVGNSSVIQTGEAQLMSAGTGITHSEFNPSKSESVNFLQIWILPKNRGIKPRYAQKSYEQNLKHGAFVPIVVPMKESADFENKGVIEINQDAVFSIGKFESAAKVEFFQNTRLRDVRKGQKFGVYFFVIEGTVDVTFKGEVVNLGKRDGCGILPQTDQNELPAVSIQTKGAARILAIEVPY